MDRKDKIKINIYKELLKEEKKKNRFMATGMATIALLVISITPFMGKSGEVIKSVDKTSYVSIENNYNDFFEEEISYNIEEEYSDFFEEI